MNEQADHRHALPVLNRRFREPSEFGPDRHAPATLLPMRFTRLDANRTVISSLGGDWLVVPSARLPDIVERRISVEDPLYGELVAKHLLLDARGQSALDLLAAKYRTRYSALAEFTGLHMFVVTLRCDHSCQYCQVSRVSADRAAFDMSEGTARRAVALVFQSPNPRIKIEFQGGESLLNFERIRQIVELAHKANLIHRRDLQFVVATNLAPLTDEMLAFFAANRVLVSTSLDGPAYLHNANRPRPGGNSHELAVQGIARCRAALGDDAVSALMTTTMRSLDAPEHIIDEYLAQGFSSIFLRSLSPYGFAVRTGRAIGYPVDRWNAFYERGLRYIISLNQAGRFIREEYATLVLRKLLTPAPTRYVDLMSPSGLGIAAVVYNYDGSVYASDESRMLAESGDHTFRLGDVYQNSYDELFLSGALEQLIADTMTDATPMCVDCAFEPYCGTDPAFHRATQGDPMGHRPTSAFCKRHLSIFRLLIRLLVDEPEAAAVLRGWL